MEKLKPRIKKFLVECHLTCHINGKVQSENVIDLASKFKKCNYDVYSDDRYIIATS